MVHTLSWLGFWLQNYASYFGGENDPRNNDDNTLGQSEYDFKYLTFPADLANDYIGHYIVININVPVFGLTGRARSAYRNTPTTDFGQNLLQSEFSKVDSLRFGNAVDVGGLTPITGSKPVNAEPLAFPRFTRRIKESIAMFMPSPVVYNTINEFQEVSLTSFAGGLVTSTAGIVAGAVAKAVGGETPGRLASGLVDAIGNSIGTVAGLSGYPINPRVEVMFSKTNLRQFVLEFLMAPRNAEESENMKAIIKTLRFHSAPELDSLTGGFTYIPPAEFDITFFNKGVENTNIPRINTCVMDRIEVDYAPTGEYATFSNGHPVVARLSLGMREIEVVHKRRVLQGF